MLQKLPNQILKNNDSMVPIYVIKELIGRKGHPYFDIMTKSKVIETVSVKMDYNYKEFVEWLIKVFRNGTMDSEAEVRKTEKDVTICRSYVVNQLYLLVKSSKLEDTDEKYSVSYVLSFLFLHGYFTIVKKTKTIGLLSQSCNVTVSKTTQTLCRQKFFSMMTELSQKHQQQLNGKSESKSVANIGGLSHDGEFYSYKITKFAKELLENPKYVQLIDTWTPDVSDTFMESFEFIRSLKEEKHNVSDALTQGAILLFTHATLQLFSNAEEAADILKDLITCFRKAEEKKRQKKTEPHWTEVLTENLFGFLAQPSHLMRQVVDVVYPAIIPHLTENAFNMLTEAIQPKKDNDNFEIDDDSDNEEMDVVQESNEESDVEVDEKLKSNEEGTTDENESDSSSDDDDNEDESDIEIDAQFKTDIKSALGDSAANSEDENENDESDEDIDMDNCDPKLLESMDKKLAAVFHAKKLEQQEKRQQKYIKQSLVHYRLRVLDLVDIFIKKESKNPKIMNLLLPLLDTIKSSQGRSDEQALFERTLGIYKNKLCQLHEYPSGIDLDVEKTHGLIEEMINRAKTATSALFVTYITQGIIYLVRVLRGSHEIKEPSPVKTRNQRKRKNKETETKSNEDSNHERLGCLDVGRITKYFTDALIEYMTKRSSHLQPILFTEYIQRFPSLGWDLGSTLPKMLNDGCNNFRKMKALEMIKLLLTKKSELYQKKLIDLSPDLIENLAKVFDSTSDEKCSFKSRQLHDFVHLVDTLLKLFEKNEVVVDLSLLETSLGDAMKRANITRSPPLLTYCEKVAKHIDTYKREMKSPKKKKNV